MPELAETGVFAEATLAAAAGFPEPVRLLFWSKRLRAAYVRGGRPLAARHKRATTSLHACPPEDRRSRRIRPRRRPSSPAAGGVSAGKVNRTPAILLIPSSRSGCARAASVFAVKNRVGPQGRPLTLEPVCLFQARARSGSQAARASDGQDRCDHRLPRRLDASPASQTGPIRERRGPQSPSPCLACWPPA